MPGNNNEYTTQPIQTRPSLDAFRPIGLISRARPVTSKSNPLINVILKKEKTNPTHAEALRLQPTTYCFAQQGGLTKDNVNEWVTFACDGTGPADESNRTKRVQGWSRLNWLGGILIIVSWHIHFNKLSMPLTPVCCFANQLQGLQFP